MTAITSTSVTCHGNSVGTCGASPALKIGYWVLKAVSRNIRASDKNGSYRFATICIGQAGITLDWIVVFSVREDK